MTIHELVNARKLDTCAPAYSSFVPKRMFPKTLTDFFHSKDGTLFVAINRRTGSFAAVGVSYVIWGGVEKEIKRSTILMLDK